MQAIQVKVRTIQQTLAFIQQMTSFHPIGQLIDSPHASCMTIHQCRTFSLFLDDKADDTRICLYWFAGHRSMSYVTLSQYDHKKNTWTSQDRQGQIELNSNAGQSKLFKRFEEFGNEFAFSPRPRMLCLYNRNGKWGK